MSWDYLPMEDGQLISTELLNEIRHGILERMHPSDNWNPGGLADEFEEGQLLTVEMLETLRDKTEESVALHNDILVAYPWVFSWNTSPGHAQNMFNEAFGGGASDWPETNDPGYGLTVDFFDDFRTLLNIALLTRLVLYNYEKEYDGAGETGKASCADALSDVEASAWVGDANIPNGYPHFISAPHQIRVVASGWDAYKQRVATALGRHIPDVRVGFETITDLDTIGVRWRYYINHFLVGDFSAFGADYEDTNREITTYVRVGTSVTAGTYASLSGSGSALATITHGAGEHERGFGDVPYFLTSEQPFVISSGGNDAWIIAHPDADLSDVTDSDLCSEFPGETYWEEYAGLKGSICLANMAYAKKG